MEVWSCTLTLIRIPNDIYSNETWIVVSSWISVDSIDKWRDWTIVVCSVDLRGVRLDPRANCSNPAESIRSIFRRQNWAIPTNRLWIISLRWSLVKHMDRIVVSDDGTIVSDKQRSDQIVGSWCDPIDDNWETCELDEYRFDDSVARSSVDVDVREVTTREKRFYPLWCRWR